MKATWDTREKVKALGRNLSTIGGIGFGPWDATGRSSTRTRSDQLRRRGHDCLLPFPSHLPVGEFLMALLHIPVLLTCVVLVGCAAVDPGAASTAAAGGRSLPPEFSVRWYFQAHHSHRTYTGVHELSSVKVEAASGKVTGTVDVHSNNCRATKVPIGGTYDGTSLSLKTTENVDTCGLLTIDLKRTEGRLFNGTYGYSNFLGLRGMGGTFVATTSLP